jgi:hypothetical protein
MREFRSLGSVRLSIKKFLDVLLQALATEATENTDEQGSDFIESRRDSSRATLLRMTCYRIGLKLHKLLFNVYSAIFLNGILLPRSFTLPMEGFEDDVKIKL